PQRSPTITLFPYTTLFRSQAVAPTLLRMCRSEKLVQSPKLGEDKPSPLLCYECVAQRSSFRVPNWARTSRRPYSATNVSLREARDRKSTRLNSSHGSISYA